MIDGGSVVLELLTQAAGVVRLTGADRIFDSVFPPGTFRLNGDDRPAITVNNVGRQRAQTHGEAPTLFLPRVQVSCWSQDADAARELSEAVDSALDRYRGVVLGAEVQTIVVLDDPPDMYEPETKLFHTPIEARLALGLA